MACGLFFGIMVLRLTKIYLAFATLALSQMIWAIAWKWRDLTGGDDGLTGWSDRTVSIPLVGQFGLTDVTSFYYFILIFAVVSIGLSWHFTKTPLGNTLAGIKINPHRMGFLGVNVNRAKLEVFTFSGLIAGLSGALFMLMKKMVSPHFLDMSMSFDVLIISVIGGYASFVGPIVGSFIYVYLMEYLSSFTERWQLLMGAFFVLLLLCYPRGIVGMIGDVLKKITSGRLQGEAMADILALKGVVKDFGRFRVINGVDLVVCQGERHALIGPNGAGKSISSTSLPATVCRAAGSFFKGTRIDGLPPYKIVDSA